MRLGFTIHHNGPALGLLAAEHRQCERKWAGICNYHAGKFGTKWARSVYSFAVCPHGIRFVGQGWDRRQAANGRDVVGEYDGKDSEWFTVCVLIGTGEAPPQAMIDAVAALIDEGRSTGRCRRRVLPHNAFKRKACPGPEFTELAAKWNNADIFTSNTDPTEDDTMFVELILDAYRGKRGRRYDPRTSDPDGWRFWMERLATGTSVNGGSATPWQTVQEVRWIIAANGG